MKIDNFIIMNEEQVKKLIGVNHWVEFKEWMRGQTVGVNNDSSIDYYDSDVERFIDGRTRQF